MIKILIGKKPVIAPVTVWGWEADPPSDKDWLFEGSPLDTSTTPSGAADNARFFKAISQQLWLPSCVGNASADKHEADKVRELVTGGLSLEQAHAKVAELSRMFVWWNARNMMDPPQHHNTLAGTHNRLAIEVFARFGVPPESDWPYDPKLATTRPSIKAFRNARRYMTDAFYRLADDPDKRIAQCIKAVKTEHNVLCGTIVTDAFRNYESGTLVRPASLTGAGRHALVICGWDGKSRFKVRNSWGDEWGEGGYCWMDQGYIAWKETKSLWV